jgi:hypothetical protein
LGTKEVKKIKKQTIKTFIPLLLISLTLLFCLTTVSAADNDTIYVNGSSGNDSWDGQSAVYNSTSGSGPKLSIINATGTVNSNGTVFIADGTYNEHGITINQNMTIIGESQTGTIINAQGQDRIFIINPEITVTLENLILQNGFNYFDNGGAIYNEGTLNLVNCTFAANRAGFGSGGAIANGGTLNIANSAFNGNDAGYYMDYLDNGYTTGNGGAIYNWGTLTITNSAFNSNGVKGHGGAIQSNGTLNITNSTFTGNTGGAEDLYEGMDVRSPGWGGAIENRDGTATITNSTFTNNMACYGVGGAILNRGGTLTITNSTLNNNAVKGGTAGAIYNYLGTLTITNCTLTDNSATIVIGSHMGYGSVIYGPASGGAICNYQGILTLTNSTLTSNSATGGDGGAILNYADDGYALAFIINSTFTGNYAYNTGPFMGNIGGSGGAICNVAYANNGTAFVSITSSIFTDNCASWGGAVFTGANNGTAFAYIKDSVFTGNSASHGGAIYDIIQDTGNSTVNVNFNRIVGNIADNSNSSGICNVDGTVDATNNWWGNNNPIFSQLLYGMPDPDSWLVMNATATPLSIRVGDISTITVIISSYNKTSGTYSPVVHCAPLPTIFTATLGDMNPGSAFIIPNLGIDQLISLFTSTQEGTAAINATVDNETVIFSIQANKTLTNITVLNVTGYYGNNATLTAILKDDQGHPISGETIHFSVNFKYMGDGITDSTGTATMDCPLDFDPDPDPYTIFAILYSNNKYNASIGTGNLTVNINPTTISVSNVEGYCGNNATLTAILKDSQGQPVSGETVFDVNNQIVSTITDSTGTAIINNYLLNLPPGVYIINAVFIGNHNYTSSMGSGTLTVNAIPTNVNATSVHNFAGQTVPLTANVTDYNGNPVNGGAVTFTIGSTIINSIPVNSGIASWTWTIPLNWNVNIYTITADFDETGTNYANSIGTGNLTVDATPTHVSVVNVHNFPGQNVTLTADVKDYYGHSINEGSVRFTVNGNCVDTVSVNNGQATLNWTIPSDWSAGTYPDVIFAEYLGTGNFTASNSYGNITVDATPTNITIGNFTGINSQTVTLNTTLTDVYGHLLTGKTINFKINGNSIGNGTTDSNGIATLNYKLNNAGNFTVTVEFAGDSGYVNSTGNGTLTVDPSSDLYIIITSNKNNPRVGETFILTYKLGNKGPDEATNVVITIPLSEGFKKANIWGDGNWTYNANNNTITWTLTSVPVGDPYLYITGKVTKAGTYVFSSSISSETYNIDSEGVTPTIINAVNEVKAASKTIPLRHTGLPLAGLVLAILSIFGGFVMPKRKN